MEEFLWVEKYRPQKVADVILPDSIKTLFQKYVDQKDIPNLLLVGTHGVGKTTIAKAMIDEIGSSFLFINGSLDGGKDMLRTDIREFASSLAMQGGRKFVILDEADYLTHQMQPALRNFMEEYSSNCGFILTCNHKHKIIPELQSRCSTVEFKFTNEDKKVLIKQMLLRAMKILDTEGIEYDNKVLAELIVQKYPDFRKVLNELQKYSVNGKIDTGIFVNFSDVAIKDLFSKIKAKDFDGMQKWIHESDVDENELYTKLYDVGEQFITKDSRPMLVLLLSKYQQQANFAANPEINTMACFLEMAVDLEFE